GALRPELVEVERKRDHLAFLHQPGSRDDVLRARIVERADLVVRSPFAPVLVRLGGLAHVVSGQLGDRHGGSSRLLSVNRRAPRAVAPQRMGHKSEPLRAAREVGQSRLVPPLPKFVTHWSSTDTNFGSERGTSKFMILVPLFELTFLNEVAASGVGASNRRH